MDVGDGGFQAMHIRAASVLTNVGLPAEIILVALLRLSHLWIALLFLVLGRTRSLDERGIHYGPAVHEIARLLECVGEGFTKGAAYLNLFQQEREKERAQRGSTQGAMY